MVLRKESQINPYEVRGLDKGFTWLLKKVNNEAAENISDICNAIQNASNITFEHRPSLKGGGEIKKAFSIINKSYLNDHVRITYFVHVPNTIIEWYAENLIVRTNHITEGKYEIKIPTASNSIHARSI